MRRMLAALALLALGCGGGEPRGLVESLGGEPIVEISRDLEPGEGCSILIVPELVEAYGEVEIQKACETLALRFVDRPFGPVLSVDLGDARDEDGSITLSGWHLEAPLVIAGASSSAPAPALEVEP